MCPVHENSESAGVTDMHLFHAMQPKNLERVVMLPDGGSAICQVSRKSLEPENNIDQLYLVSLEGKYPPEALKDTDNVSSFCALNNEYPLVIIRNKGAYFYNPGMERKIKLIPESESPLEMTAAPDGTKIFFTAASPGLEDQRLRTKGIVLEDTQIPVQVFAVDVRSGKIRQITFSPGVKKNISVSPDGNKIAFTELETESWKQPARAALKTINVDGTDEKTILGGAVRCARPHWSPDGKRIAFVRRSPSTFADDYLAVISPADGREHILTSKFDRRVLDLRWRDNHNILFLLHQGFFIDLLEISPETKTLRRIITDSGIKSFDTNLNSSHIAFISSNFDSPSELFSIELDGSNYRQLSSFNQHINNFDMFPSEIVQWKNSEGRTIEGVLTKAKTDKSLPPLLVEHHGGTPNAYTCAYMHFPQFHAMHGISSLRVNYRGSSGYGQEFMESLFGRWTTGPADDGTTGAEMLIARNLVDPARIGIAGDSGGAMISGTAIGISNIYKAAVLGCGLYDLSSFYRGAFWQNVCDQILGGSPSEFPDFYRKESAFSYASQVNTPTLLWCGEQDKACPISQTEMFYGLLKRNNIPIEFIRYQNEGHGISDYSRMSDMVERRISWLKKYL